MWRVYGSGACAATAAAGAVCGAGTSAVFCFLDGEGASLPSISCDSRLLRLFSTAGLWYSWQRLASGQLLLLLAGFVSCKPALMTGFVSFNWVLLAFGLYGGLNVIFCFVILFVSCMLVSCSILDGVAEGGELLVHNSAGLSGGES